MAGVESAMDDCPPPAPHRAGDEASKIGTHMALLSAAPPAEATSAVASSFLVVVPVRQAPAQQRPHRRQEAQQHKERNGRKRQCISPLDSGT